MGDSSSHCGQRGHSPGWVCLRGMEASQLPGCVCVVFCGEWRRVSFRVVCVLSSAGNGGKSASRGAKGNGGQSALEFVVYFLFFGGPMSTGSPNLVSLTLVAPMSQMRGSQHSVEDHRLVDTPAAPPARHRSLAHLVVPGTELLQHVGLTC